MWPNKFKQPPKIQKLINTNQLSSNIQPYMLKPENPISRNVSRGPSGPSSQVKTVIYEEADWLERHRIAAYIVLYVQFLQMVLAFNVHPRVAMLTSTIQTPGGS